MKTKACGITLKKSRYTNTPPAIRIECCQRGGPIYVGLFYTKSQEFKVAGMGGDIKFTLRMLSASFLCWAISLNWVTCRYAPKF